MCGRFALTATVKEVEAFMALLDIEAFPPRYNIAPTQPIMVVVGTPPRQPGSNLPDRQAILARWGLLPAWTKKADGVPVLFNARAETVTVKPAFRGGMRYRRALVPASGFYEWRREGYRAGQAYWVRPKRGGLVAFAGLVETYLGPDGSELETAAIITKAATSDLAGIHERMPAVIGPEHFARWLDCASNEPREVVDLLGPAEPGLFEAIPVSSKINKVANAGPDVQEPVKVGAAEPPVPAAGRRESTSQPTLL